MESYIDDVGPVNAEVHPVEIPAFLPRRPAQAASKRRRRIAPEMWGTLRAAQVREYQSLPPDSPRVRPTLPRLRLLGKPELGGGEAA